MRIVTLEEHISFPEMVNKLPIDALDTFGIDNIMFSIDYPFSTNEMGIDFLNAIDLPKEQIEKIASVNADKLLGLTENNRTKKSS
jgi:predicted TIM-barrel fold metal-dependent hydrolase